MNCRKFSFAPWWHDTFNRVLQLIEPQALEAFLRGVAQWLAQATGVPQTIAVDGKTLRGSQKAGKAIHLLNAWADKARLVIGQRLVDGKSNEIVALPQLLDSLFLDGCVVTVDALNTQTAIAQKIVDKGADYVLPLKGNHPTHQSVVAAIMRDVAASRPPDLEQVEKDHGRLDAHRPHPAFRRRPRNHRNRPLPQQPPRRRPRHRRRRPPALGRRKPMPLAVGRRFPRRRLPSPVRATPPKTSPCFAFASGICSAATKRPPTVSAA